MLTHFEQDEVQGCSYPWLLLLICSKGARQNWTTSSFLHNSSKLELLNFACLNFDFLFLLSCSFSDDYCLLLFKLGWTWAFASWAANPTHHFRSSFQPGNFLKKIPSFSFPPSTTEAFFSSSGDNSLLRSSSLHSQPLYFRCLPLTAYLQEFSFSFFTRFFFFLH